MLFMLSSLRYLKCLKWVFIALTYEDVIRVLYFPECQSLLIQSEIKLAQELLGAVVDGTIFRAAASLHVSAILESFAAKDLVRGDGWRQSAEHFQSLASLEMDTVTKLSCLFVTMPSQVTSLKSCERLQMNELFCLCRDRLIIFRHDQCWKLRFKRKGMPSDEWLEAEI